jgi:lipopolysaccharide assembly outer membrane protein LptD (OstA)
MGIKSFIFILLFLSISTYFIPIKKLEKNETDKDLPQVIFENPVMYTLNDKNIHRVVIAEHAVKYQNRDEMFNADITLNNQDETKEFKSENLKADKIVKKGDVYTLTNNVKYKRDDFIKLNTNHLIYDDVNKIAKNNKPFQAIYNDNIFNGTNLYLDINNDNIKAKNAHFEIDMTKN